MRFAYGGHYKKPMSVIGLSLCRIQTTACMYCNSSKSIHGGFKLLLENSIEITTQITALQFLWYM